MKNRLDLTEGRITEKLLRLSLPIMGTSFIQMGYNMIDMIWVGKAGSKAVAAVGTAGFFPWLAMAFIMISKVGGEVKVAQSIGENNISTTKSYIKSAVEINIMLAIMYTMVLIVLNKQLIGFFRLGDLEVISMSRQYLIIVALGMVFYFINPVFTAIFNGLGNSRTPFCINTIGLITNIILDPVLIFGWGPAPKLGVAGAAIATVFAQIVVTTCFLYIIFKSKEEYFKIKIFRKIELKYYKVLYKLGFPVAIQSGMFTIFSMLLGVIVASWGPVAVAVQKVGSQIEAISWMTAEGLAVALGSFVGQNYGAKKYSRINKGCKIAIIVSSILGIMTTLVLIFAGGSIFSVFIDESEAIEKGAMYLKILGYSQFFMCLEIITTGAFKGLGRTYIPSIIVTVLTGARVPLAYFISRPEILGLNGVWWSITLSSILKGILMISLFIYLLKLGKLYKVSK
ncbi:MULTISPECIES: MATE family efflux transporter [unclassified Clostridioides]|uniref:MATE family efflux transporter n=1 Tax=unclassified Clostridioides TaxID=2635829 RepID=UPI001D11E944|nr:MATE family efflux transporter [Clostridioides sp. ZZV14-6150]MCC0660745.1 MATE family efflux transporter [Clostridioides sp. ZZV14-6154]MCC0668093.1 MATE family efflux transporter [Clostridioides sp. ZZV14-6153]MCC0717380.1 MATE family efflux transporter [Clostridioides sp. ZZV14-6105]MCC0721493.1 MATE family efflux transporter [Clostridioides sp. ZZV14-6104]MCC0727876.1 MATE family efflux transporter [Clostridioides sp. ZZV14-6045]MCC0734430.1 MATE family efflux transporter [Clostridioid